MRVEGRWHRFKDSVLRPMIDVAVQTPHGTWQSVTLLLDAGADRTVFDVPMIQSLNDSILPTASSPLANPSYQTLR